MEEAIGCVVVLGVGLFWPTYRLKSDRLASNGMVTVMVTVVEPKPAVPVIGTGSPDRHGRGSAWSAPITTTMAPVKAGNLGPTVIGWLPEYRLRVSNPGFS